MEETSNASGDINSVVFTLNTTMSKVMDTKKIAKNNKLA